jgi:hypothetical protein
MPVLSGSEPRLPAVVGEALRARDREIPIGFPCRMERVVTPIYNLAI